MTQGRWLVLALLLPLTAALPLGCDAPGKPNPAERPVTPDQVVCFTELYRTNCSGCHGADGKLGPAPPLNDPLFRGIVSEADLEHVISAGRPGTPMPAFSLKNGGPLTAVQVQILVKQIKGIPYEVVATSEGGKPRKVVASTKGTPPKWGTPPDVSAAPPYALAKAGGDPKKGAHVFTRACAGCHGQQGQGGENGESRLRINDPAFLALISDQALRRIVITGRPDLGMPDYADKSDRPGSFQPLTSEQITNVVALLASWREGSTANGR